MTKTTTCPRCGNPILGDNLHTCSPKSFGCLWNGCYEPRIADHDSFCEKHRALFNSQFTPTDYFKMVERVARSETSDE